MRKDSGFLSLVLRHKPEEIGLQLDENGWASVDELLLKMKIANRRLSREALVELVETSDKKRFTLSDDGQRIRAAQGHSIDIQLGVEHSSPPAELFHGTARTNLDSIFAEGLKPGTRQQVHLSLETETAIRVGQRHGKPVVLTVASGKMQSDGYKFYRADNGVWLTDHVPAPYLGFASDT